MCKNNVHDRLTVAYFKSNVITVKLRMWWYFVVLMVTDHPVITTEEMNYGFPVENYTKIERYGVASQESTGWGGFASKAIDGNTKGRWASGTCTHTKTRASTTWWKLSFPVYFQVDIIAIWNRITEIKTVKPLPNGSIKPRFTRGIICVQLLNTRMV